MKGNPLLNSGFSLSDSFGPQPALMVPESASEDSFVNAPSTLSHAPPSSVGTVASPLVPPMAMGPPQLTPTPPGLFLLPGSGDGNNPVGAAPPSSMSSSSVRPRYVPPPASSIPTLNVHSEHASPAIPPPSSSPHMPPNSNSFNNLVTQPQLLPICYHWFYKNREKRNRGGILLETLRYG